MDGTGIQLRGTGDRTPTRNERRWTEKRGGVPLGSVFGIRLHADFSLGLIFVLVATNLGIGVLPEWHPNWPAPLVWTVAVTAALLFFVSILLHELSHALVGRAVGVPVHRITLFFFGGMAHMENEPPNPRAEFLMAGVGPVTSLAIGGIATGAGLLLGPDLDMTREASDYLQQLGPAATLLLWLGPINVGLAVFNLVPGFPLDGGRMLRAMIWGLTGDLRKATSWASRAGQLVAWLLIAWGVTQILDGSFLQGVWIVLIGFFLNAAAHATDGQMALRAALDGILTEQIMLRHFAVVSPEATVDELVKRHLLTSEQCVPVGSGDTLEGVVCRNDVHRARREDWSRTPTRRVMTPTGRLTTISPSTPALAALRLLGSGNVDQLPVLEGTRLVGVLRQQDFLTWLSTHRHRI